MPQATEAASLDHSVTYENTRKHWVLYTLDALEASRQDEGESESFNPARDKGVYPREIYEFAAGDDSIVFWSKREVQTLLSEMARDGDPWEAESRAVNRRTDSTEWDEADVEFRYRLNDYGRKVLLDLGVPDQLPNRREMDEADRSLGVKPAHEPGWWQDDWELYGSEWDINDHDWTPTEYDRVFYKEEAAQLFEERGYLTIGKKLAESFEDVTFVLSIGPYRPHDLMYAIRDPWRKVVQIDIYSPMAQHRETDEITANFESLVKDLYHALDEVSEDE